MLLFGIVIKMHVNPSHQWTDTLVHVQSLNFRLLFN